MLKIDVDWVMSVGFDKNTNSIYTVMKTSQRSYWRASFCSRNSRIFMLEGLPHLFSLELPLHSQVTFQVHRHLTFPWSSCSRKSLQLSATTMWSTRSLSAFAWNEMNMLRYSVGHNGLQQFRQRTFYKIPFLCRGLHDPWPSPVATGGLWWA